MKFLGKTIYNKVKTETKRPAIFYMMSNPELFDNFLKLGADPNVEIFNINYRNGHLTSKLIIFDILMNNSSKLISSLLDVNVDISSKFYFDDKVLSFKNAFILEIASAAIINLIQPEVDDHKKETDNIMDVTTVLASRGIILDNADLEFMSKTVNDLNNQFFTLCSKEVFNDYINRIEIATLEGARQYSSIELKKKTSPFESVSKSIYDSLSTERQALNNEGKKLVRHFLQFLQK